MKLINTPDDCEICKSSLGDYFWYCRNCEKFLCYSCIVKHNEHDIVALEFIKPGKAKLLPISGFGAGPTDHKWTTYPKKEFIEQFKLCPHLLDYLNAKKVIFQCEKCNELVCPECIEEHEKHDNDNYILPYVLLNDNRTIRMVHPQFYPGVNVNVTQYGPNISNKGENIDITIKIENMSIKPIKDIEIFTLSISKQDHIDPESYSKDWYIELHYPKYLLFENKETINEIKPKETKEIALQVYIPKDNEVNIPINNPLTIYTYIFYKTLLNDPNAIYAKDLDIKLRN